MTEEEKVKDWAHFVKASPNSYMATALLGVLKNDGERIFLQVLKKLGLEKTSDLIHEMSQEREIVVDLNVRVRGKPEGE